VTKRSTILVAVLAGLLAPRAAAGRDITLAAFPSNDPEKLGAVMRER
jgi:hypothetical protein